MGILEIAKNDIKGITSDKDTGFGVEQTFEAPNGKIAIVVGLHTKHHLSVDLEGNNVNGKNTHSSIHEQLLIDAGYPVRNTDGEVDFKGHKVTAPDSNGNQITYVINEWFPDESVGLIVCILGDFIDG